MRAKGDAFRFDRASYELTFDFPDMTAEQTKQVVAYLREAATRNTGEAAKRLGFLADRLEKHDGVNFEQLSLKDALAKAAKEGKQVFVDCYTSWCGPCKKLAREVFPQPEVGKVLNARFINLQIDMEREKDRLCLSSLASTPSPRCSFSIPTAPKSVASLVTSPLNACSTKSRKFPLADS